jgi:hypothetical protein
MTPVAQALQAPSGAEVGRRSKPEGVRPAARGSMPKARHSR